MAKQVTEESDFQDPLQQPCSEKNLADIAKQLISWEPVHTHLDVTQSEAETIKRNYPQDHEYQKLEVLNSWKLKRGPFQATFKALIDVFNELKNQDMVETIKSVAAKAHQAQSSTLVTELKDDITAVDFDKLEDAARSLGLLSDHTVLTETLNTAANDHKKKEVLLEFLGDLQRPQLINFIIRVASLNSKEGKPHKVPLSQTVSRKADKQAHIDQMFRQTVKKIREHFKRCDVKELIINFNMSAESIPSITVKTKETLRDCNTEQDLFLNLSPYITWCKRDVLQTLVEVSDIKEAKIELQNFESQVDPNWLINDLPLPTASPTICPDTQTSGMTLVAVTTKKDLNTLTLRNVEDLQETVAQCGGISKEALDLQAKHTGSSVLYWLLPQMMVKKFEENIRRNLTYLYNEGIVEIALDPNIVITTGPHLRIRALSYLTKPPPTSEEIKEYSGNIDELAELYHQLKGDIDERDKKIMTLEADLKRLEHDKAEVEEKCGSLKEQLASSLDTLVQLHGTIEDLQSSQEQQPFVMELDTVTSKQPITSASEKEVDELVVGTRGHQVVKWRESFCIGGGYTLLDDDQYRPQMYNLASPAFCWPSTDQRLLPICPVKWFSPVVIDDRLITVGGVDSISDRPTNKLYYWNDLTLQWEEFFPPMITPRLFATSALYRSQYLIVIGGAYDANASKFVDDIEVLDVSSRQWYKAEPLPKPTANKQAAIIDDTLFLLGGWLKNLKDTSAWSCDLPQLLQSIRGVESHMFKKSKLSTAWKAIEPPLPSSSIAAVGEYLVAVGGWEPQDDSPSDIIQRYHPDTNTWIHLDRSLEYPRAAAAAIACSKNKVLVFGGRIGESLHSTTIECITLDLC